MQTRGAVVRQAPGKYEVVDLELDDPRPDEVQVKMVGSGLCHSDDHIATGDLPVGIYPFAGGHEGAGIVTKVGRCDQQGHQGGRPRHLLLPALVRALPLVCVEHAEPVRPRRRHPHGRSPDRPELVPVEAGGHRHVRRPDVGHLDVLRDHHRVAGLLREGARGHPARRGLPPRLRRRHRVGLGGQLRRRPARSHDDRHGHRRHRYQRRAGRVPRRGVQHHRGGPGGVQAREGPGARGDARRRDDGRSHRARQAVHQRSGCRPDHRHRRRHQARARRAGDGLDPQGGHGRRHGTRRHHRHHPATGVAGRHHALPEAHPGHPLRGVQPELGHPAPDRALPLRRAEARRADHQDLRARRDPAGLPDMHDGKNIRGVIKYAS